MSDVFISYSRADGPRAETLTRALEAQGWSVWWDSKMQPGLPFGEEIEREISTAKCVLVLWSESSVHRQWVISEATRGLDRHVLIPVRLDGVSLPMPFDQLQTASLEHWRGESDDPELHRLLQSVARQLKVQPPKLPEPPAPSLWERLDPRLKWSLAGLGVAGALTWAGLAAWSAFGPHRGMVRIPASEFALGNTVRMAESQWRELGDGRKSAEDPGKPPDDLGKVVLISPSRRLGDGTVEKENPAAADDSAREENTAEPGKSAEDENPENPAMPAEGVVGESPAKPVELPAFYIDRHEVTVEDYFRRTKRRSWDPFWEEAQRGDRLPVVGVTWAEAKKYCEDQAKSLPTEAQWELAARGREGRLFPWGADRPEPRAPRANFCDEPCGGETEVEDGHRLLAPVGSFRGGRSPRGVYDLAGNAAEWVLDWYSPDFYRKLKIGEESPQNREEPGDPTQKLRVVRGGSWNSSIWSLRGASRSARDPADRQTWIGFRCVRNLPPD